MYGVLIFAFFRNVKVLQLLFKPYFKIRTQQINLIAEATEKYEF